MSLAGASSGEASMKLDTGLSQEVSGMHLLPPGLATPTSGLQTSDSPMTQAPPPDIPMKQARPKDQAPLPLGAAMGNFLETRIVDTMDYMILPDSADVTFDAGAMFDTQAIFGKALEHIGFRPSDLNPWSILGISRAEGPEPSLEMVENRMRLLDGLLETAGKTGWGSEPAARKAIDEGRKLVEEARERCAEQVPAAKKDHRKGRNQEWQKWAELEPSFANHLIEGLRRDKHQPLLLTQISSIMRPYEKDRFIPSPSETYASLQQLTGGNETSKEMLNQQVRPLNCDGSRALVLWSPTDRDAFNRLLGAFTNYWRSAQEPGQILLILIIPILVHHNCTTPEELLDIWSHPSLEDKWKPHRSGIRFIRDPVHMITTGQAGPQKNAKQLAIVKFEAVAQPQPAVLAQWRTSLVEAQVREFITVDFPAEMAPGVQRALTGHKAPEVLRWEGPSKSPATSAKEPRYMLRGYLRQECSTYLQIQLIISELQDLLGMGGTLIGHSLLFKDKAAMVLEATGVNPITQMDSRLEATILLAPGRALAVPRGTQQEWEIAISTQNTQDPNNAITKLR